MITIEGDGLLRGIGKSFSEFATVSNKNVAENEVGDQLSQTAVIMCLMRCRRGEAQKSMKVVF